MDRVRALREQVAQFVGTQDGFRPGILPVALWGVRIRFADDAGTGQRAHEAGALVMDRENGTFMIYNGPAGFDLQVGLYQSLDEPTSTPRPINNAEAGSRFAVITPSALYIEGRLQEIRQHLGRNDERGRERARDGLDTVSGWNPPLSLQEGIAAARNELTVQEMLVAASEQFARGSLDEARTQLRRVLEIDPRNNEASDFLRRVEARIEQHAGEQAARIERQASRDYRDELERNMRWQAPAERTEFSSIADEQRYVEARLAWHAEQRTRLGAVSVPEHLLTPDATRMRQGFLDRIGSAEEVLRQRQAELEEETSEERRRIHELDHPPQPALVSEQLKSNEPESFVYETHGPIVFFIVDKNRPIFFRIRRQRSTGRFELTQVRVVKNDPHLHPHLVVFRRVGNTRLLNLGSPNLLGNREILIRADEEDRHTVSITDQGSSHGTFVVRETRVGVPENLTRQVKFDDWHRVESIFRTLGESIIRRTQKGYASGVYQKRLAQTIGSWASLEQKYQERLLSHLFVVRGWARGDSRQSAEWLRRFFRLYHHVFYMSPRAAVSQGRKGSLVFGRVAQYLPVNWRGLRSATLVHPIYTNAKAGFKPSTNDDEVIVLLDGTPTNKLFDALHEFGHAAQMLEFSQYGLLGFEEQGAVQAMGKAMGAEVAIRDRDSILRWEMEYDSYALSMIAVGQAIQAAEEAGHREGAPVNAYEVFVNQEALDRHLENDESQEEHDQAANEFVPVFIREVFHLMEQEGLGVLELREGMNGREIRRRFDFINQQAPGRIIRQVAEGMRRRFWMDKLGYVPSWPDIMAVKPVDVIPPRIETLWKTEEGLHRVMQTLQRNSQAYETNLEILKELEERRSSRHLSASFLMQALGYFTQVQRHEVSSREDVEALFGAVESLQRQVRRLVVRTNDNYGFSDKPAWISLNRLLLSVVRMQSRLKEPFMRFARERGPITMPLIPMEPLPQTEATGDGVESGLTRRAPRDADAVVAGITGVVGDGFFGDSSLARTHVDEADSTSSILVVAHRPGLQLSRRLIPQRGHLVEVLLLDKDGGSTRMSEDGQKIWVARERWNVDGSVDWQALQDIVRPLTQGHPIHVLIQPPSVDASGADEFVEIIPESVLQQIEKANPYLQRASPRLKEHFSPDQRRILAGLLRGSA